MWLLFLIQQNLLNNVYYDTGINAQEYHNQIGDWYQVPHVSIKDTVYKRMKQGEYTRDELTEDGLHPNDKGHGLVADEIIKLLEETVKNMIAPYQYILNVPEEPEEDEKYTVMGMLQKFLTPSLKTSEKSAEKFCMEALKNVVPGKDGESITVYGISENSEYVSRELPSDGVLISDGYSEKYKVKEGDTITLKESYGSEEYEFTVRGIYDYPGALTVFMPIMSFRDAFDKDADYFNGYFSQEKIKDLDEDLIAATITEDDLTKVSRQLDVSMGEMFQLINVFSVILFALLIYLLTKLIIEKNATAISMVKILGYEDKEIISLYLTSTTWVVVFSILFSLALSTWTIYGIYGYLMSSFSGWLTLYLEPVVYPEMFAMGMGAYVLVALLQFRRIRKIPMDVALKNVE